MTEKPNKWKAFYMNPRFWLALLIAVLVVIITLFIVFTPAEIGQNLYKLFTDPKTYAQIAVVGAGIAGIWTEVDKRLKKTEKRVEETEEKQVKAEEDRIVEWDRNTKIEQTAAEAFEDVAIVKTTATVLSDKIDVTAEGLEFLRVQYVSLGGQYTSVNQMYKSLADELQQERAESKLVTAELRAQIKDLINQNQQQQTEITGLKENHKREIAELHAQISKMGAASTEDKKEITALRNRVTELETRVAVLDAENTHLKDENRELRGNTRRMITGQLGGLSDEAEKRLNHLEQERENAEKGETTI